MNRTERNCLFFRRLGDGLRAPYRKREGRGRAAAHRAICPGGQSGPADLSLHLRTRILSHLPMCTVYGGACLCAPVWPSHYTAARGWEQGPIATKMGVCPGGILGIWGRKAPPALGQEREKRRLTTAVGKGKPKTKLYNTNRWARRAAKGRGDGRKDPGKGAVRGAADGGRAALPAHFESGRAAALGRPGAAAGGRPGQR